MQKLLLILLLNHQIIINMYKTQGMIAILQKVITF